MVKEELKRSTEKIMQIKPETFDSTKYVVGKGNRKDGKKSSHLIVSEKPRDRQSKFLELLSSSIRKELTPTKPQYATLQPNRYSPEKRTEKYMERIKFMLPSISAARKTMAV